MVGEISVYLPIQSFKGLLFNEKEKKEQLTKDPPYLAQKSTAGQNKEEKSYNLFTVRRTASHKASHRCLCFF